MTLAGTVVAAGKARCPQRGRFRLRLVAVRPPYLPQQTNVLDANNIGISLSISGVISLSRSQQDKSGWTTAKKKGLYRYTSVLSGPIATQYLDIVVRRRGEARAGNGMGLLFEDYRCWTSNNTVNRIYRPIVDEMGNNRRRRQEPPIVAIDKNIGRRRTNG